MEVPKPTAVNDQAENWKKAHKIQATLGLHQGHSVVKVDMIDEPSTASQFRVVSKQAKGDDW